MILLIDGYNVLKQLFSHKQITQSERDNFIKQLARYKKEKRHTIIVIFDGGPYTWPVTEHIKGVEVVYSGISYDADSLIKRYIKDRVKDIILVTSDQALREWASVHKTSSMRSNDFYRLLRGNIKPTTIQKRSVKTPLIKTSDKEDSLLDEVMEAETKLVALKKEDAVSEPSARKKADKIDKKERALLRKISKL